MCACVLHRWHSIEFIDDFSSPWTITKTRRSIPCKFFEWHFSSSASSSSFHSNNLINFISFVCCPRRLDIVISRICARTIASISFLWKMFIYLNDANTHRIDFNAKRKMFHFCWWIGSKSCDGYHCRSIGVGIWAMDMNTEHEISIAQLMQVSNDYTVSAIHLIDIDIFIPRITFGSIRWHKRNLISHNPLLILILSSYNHIALSTMKIDQVRMQCAWVSTLCEAITSIRIHNFTCPIETKTEKIKSKWNENDPKSINQFWKHFFLFLKFCVSFHSSNSLICRSSSLIGHQFWIRSQSLSSSIVVVVGAPKRVFVMERFHCSLCKWIWLHRCKSSRFNFFINDFQFEFRFSRPSISHWSQNNWRLWYKIQLKNSMAVCLCVWQSEL